MYCIVLHFPANGKENEKALHFEYLYELCIVSSMYSLLYANWWNEAVIYKEVNERPDHFVLLYNN